LSQIDVLMSLMGRAVDARKQHWDTDGEKEIANAWKDRYRTSFAVIAKVT
jgi:hypothetical protein